MVPAHAAGVAVGSAHSEIERMASIFETLLNGGRRPVLAAVFYGVVPRCLVTVFGGWILCIAGVNSARGADLEFSNGLQAGFRDSTQGSPIRDIEIFQDLALYVPSDEFATPFLDAKEFVVEWRGFLSVPLRDDYRFRAFVSGDFQLELNGERVLEVIDGQGWSEAAEEVRLKKGPNSVRAVFRSRPKSDAVIRLEWSSLDFLFEPISPDHWSHTPSKDFRRYLDQRAGRTLFIEYRCGACHVESDGRRLDDNLLPGINLDGINDRRYTAWLKDWILNPQSLGSHARMPSLFRGAKAVDEVSAVVAFLRSTTAKKTSEAHLGIEGDVTAGKILFNDLNCIGCHQLGEGGPDGEDRISLDLVSQKFRRGDLVGFLRNPSEHYPAIQMPDFALTQREASNLAAFLAPNPAFAEVVAVDVEPRLLREGRELVNQRGCMNCHEGLREELGESHKPKGIEIVNVENGCLASDLDLNREGPEFSFRDDDRRVLRLLLENDRSSLKREVAREAAGRYLSSLRCSACHGELEGIPSVGHFGAKLTANWMSLLLKGQVEEKSRPWIAFRMPAFPAYSDQLAVGLSHRHGYSGQPSPEEAIDQELANTGRQLISPIGGFSCVSCHGVGEMRPTQVFESEGINFALSGARLRKDYYRRWILNPLRIDPSTKMPVYFDEEGNSPLYDVLDGDTNRQLDAIWHYLLQGKDMIPPPLE